MSRLNIDLPDKLMLEFRKHVLDEYGSLKGNTAEAVEEALKEYLIKRGKGGNCNALRPIAA